MSDARQSAASWSSWMSLEQAAVFITRAQVEYLGDSGVDVQIIRDSLSKIQCEYFRFDLRYKDGCNLDGGFDRSRIKQMKNHCAVHILHIHGKFFPVVLPNPCVAATYEEKGKVWREHDQRMLDVYLGALGLDKVGCEPEFFELLFQAHRLKQNLLADPFDSDPKKVEVEIDPDIQRRIDADPRWRFYLALFNCTKKFSEKWYHPIENLLEEILGLASTLKECGLDEAEYQSAHVLICDMGMEIHALRGDWGRAEEFARELLVDGFTGLTDLAFTCSNRIWMDAEQEDRRLFKPFRTARDRAYWTCFHSYVREYRFEEAYELIKRTDPFLWRLCESEDGRDFDLEHYFQIDIGFSWDGLGTIRQTRMRTHFADVVTLLVFQKKFVLAEALINAIEPMYEAGKRDGLDTLRRLLSIARNEQMQTDLLGVVVFAKERMRDMIQSVQNIVSGEESDSMVRADREFEEVCTSSIASAYRVGVSSCSELMERSRGRIGQVLTEDAQAILVNAFNSTVRQLVDICKERDGYGQAEQQIRELLKGLFDELDADARATLVTGQFIYSALEKKCSSAPDVSLDYSPVCLCWSKVVVGVFRDKIVLPLKQDFDEGQFAGDDRYQLYAFKNERCQKKDVDLNRWVLDESKFTLGSGGYVFGYKSDGNRFLGGGDDIRHVFKILNGFGAYKGMTFNGLKDFVREVVPLMESLSQKYRNKACHPSDGALTVVDAQACADIIFPTKHLLRLLLEGPRH